MTRVARLGQRILAFVGRLFQMLLRLPFRKFQVRRHQNEWESSNLLPYYEAHQSQDNTIYSQIGVGVYQGEAIVFRRWAFGTTYPQWMIYKLQDQYPNEIPDGMSQSLRCLAALLEQYTKQPSLWKSNLQMKVGTELVKWYPQQIQCELRLVLLQEGQSNLVTDKQPQSLKEQQQLKTEQLPKCLGCSCCGQSNMIPELRQ